MDLAEEFNATAIAAFGEGRYNAAADALGEAIALDPSNAAFYGNRSLALGKAGKFDAALTVSESCVRCDVRWNATERPPTSRTIWNANPNPN